MRPRDPHAHRRAGAEWPLVDVRTPGEWARGHIAGARSLPIQRLPASLAPAGVERARRVIAICETAHRSVPAVRLLRAAGYDARQLAGGMDAWRRAGLPEQCALRES